MKEKSYSLFLFVLFIGLYKLSFSATYYSRVNGNWNTSTTWSLISCSGVAAGSVPGAADDVIICAGRTVTMNGNPGSCLSLTINGTANWTSAFTTNIGTGGLNLNNGSSLTGSAIGIINVTGPVTVPAGATSTIGGITIAASGSTNVSGTLTFNSTGGTKTFSNIFINPGGNFNSSVSESYTISGNLSLTAGTIAGTSAGIFNVAGAFSIGAGSATFNSGTLNVSGTTTVNGALTWNATSGSKTLRNVTVSAGGVWNNSADESFDISGNLQNDGTFTSGIFGVYTLSGTGRTISGTSVTTIARITCSGSYTNNAVLSVTRRLTGSGSFTQGPAGVLNISTTDARFTVATFNASAPGNTVNYSRASGGAGGDQSVRVPADGSYSTLILSGNGTKQIIANTVFSGNVLISAATLSSNNFNITVGGNFTNNSSFIAGTANVTFNGILAQTIGGTSVTAFNDITISNATAVVSAATNFSVSSTLTVGAGAILAPAAAVIISGGTLTGNGTVRVSRTAAAPDFISQYTIAAKVLSGLNVDYIGAGNQNVNTLNYGSLTISTNGARTVTFPSAVVGVSNIFSPTAVTTTYVITGNTINFNGTITQTVPAFNYNNLSSSSTGTRILAADTIGVAAVFTPGVNSYTATGSTVNYNGAVAQTIPAFNYYNLTSSSTGTRTLAAIGTVGVASAFTPGINAYTITGSTVNFNGTAAQTVPAFNFNNLTSSSTGTRTLAAGIIGVASVFTPGTNVYTVTGSTVDYNGTAAQTIPAFNYYNLTSSSTGTRTLAASGIIGVASVFTQGANTYTTTGSTINFNGTVVQTIPAFNYFNLTSSSTGARTLAAADTVGVASGFTPGTNTYTITGSTVDFNGTVAQSIPSFTYNNLISSGSAAKVLSGNIIVQNDISISSNLDVSPSNYSISVKGNWTNNGVFNSQNGTVTFNGSVLQTLSGAGTTTFNGLDINNTSGGVSLIGGSYILNSVINPINGNFNTNGQSFTMISDASQTARIGQLGTAASLSGNFIIQRFISARDTSYADLSSTVQSSTFADWGAELPALSYTYNPPADLPSAYTYNETADVYNPVTSAASLLTPGQGYEIFLAGDFNYASLPNTTMNSIGVPNQGDFNLSGLLSNNGQGWNLVGNPFASSVSWASIYAASGGAASGLYDFIEMYDYTIGNWNGYTSADAIEIGSAQGFWVYGLPAASPLTLIVPESSKTTTSNSSIKSVAKPQPYFTLKINADNKFSHTYKMAIKEDAKDGLDSNDMPFRPSPNLSTPQLYSIIEGKKMNVNVFNSLNDNYSVSLKTSAGYSGVYSIEAAGFDFIGEYTCVQLEDRLLHKMIDLKTEGKYSFEMSSTDNPARFILHLSKNAGCRSLASLAINNEFADNITMSHSSEADLINFRFNENTQIRIQVSNLLGQNMLEKELTVTSGTEKIILPSGFKGIYLISIISDKGTVVEKFFK